MSTLPTSRIATGHRTAATIRLRPGTAARVIARLVGATAVATFALGVPASLAGPTPSPRHAVVAGDMGPTTPTAQPGDVGTASV